MNVYDSERMADVLAPLDYALCAASDEADLVILNTCHIREKATEKVFSELGRLRDQKAARAGTDAPMIIAVAGCVAQAEGDEIISRAPYVDMVFGPQTYHRLPELIAQADPSSRPSGGRAATKGAGLVETDFPSDVKFDHLPAVHGSRRAMAFLSIQEGCDKFCSFCVVPYTRGAEYSRPVAQVLAEARALARGGVRKSPCSAKTSTPITVRARRAANGGLAACCSLWPKSMAWRVCATPPRTRATWMMR